MRVSLHPASAVLTSTRPMVMFLIIYRAHKYVLGPANLVFLLLAPTNPSRLTLGEVLQPRNNLYIIFCL